MQPYFFPYLGHFSLIAQCQKWVVFDITQYTPKSWISRNRVLHPEIGWNYVSVPLLNSSISISIAQAEIGSFTDLATSMAGKLSHYRRKAPFFSSVERLLSDVFAERTSSLVHLNVRALDAVCRYLDIPFDYSIASEIDLKLPQVDHPGGWAPAISRCLGAEEYINPIGGRAIFRKADFDAVGVSLKFLHFEGFTYATGPYEFQPGLSILDVMMWSAPAAIRQAAMDGAVLISADASSERSLLTQ